MFSKDIMLKNMNFTDINPLIAGEQSSGSGDSFGPASRPLFLLHYVFSGKGEFRTPRGTFQVQQGQLFVIRPTETTFYVADIDDPWHYAWVGFQTNIDLNLILHNDVIDAPKCSRLFYSLLESYHMSSGRELHICAKIYEILAMLSSKLTTNMSPAHYVEVAQNYIASNLSQQLRIDGLAENLGLSRVYFSRIFRQYTGKSPQQYIVDSRLDKAAELLTGGAFPGEVAAQVGYDNSLNFSRMFKRRFQISPSAYRNTDNYNVSGVVSWHNIANLFSISNLNSLNSTDDEVAGSIFTNRTNGQDMANIYESGLTQTEIQTAITFWCVTADYNSFSNNVPKLEPYLTSYLTNKEAIAISQSQRPARPLSTNTAYQVWYANNSDGTYNIGLFNLSGKEATVAVKWEDIGLRGVAHVRSIWDYIDYSNLSDGFSYLLPSHGSALLSVVAESGSSLDINNDDTMIVFNTANHVDNLEMDFLSRRKYLWNYNQFYEVIAAEQDLHIKLHPNILTINSVSTSPRILRLNNDATQIVYVGNWNYHSGREPEIYDDYMGDVHWSESPGDFFTCTFCGIGVSIISELDVSHGTMDVYIDDIYMDSVSTAQPKGAPRLGQQAVYTIANLEDGIHTLKAVMNSGEFMVLDCLDIIQGDIIKVNETSCLDKEVSLTLLTPNLAKITCNQQTLLRGVDYIIIEDTLTMKKEFLLEYSTTQQPQSLNYAMTLTFHTFGDFRNDISLTEHNGDSFSYSFTGVAVQLIGPTGPQLGEIDIYIDENYEVTINTFSKFRKVRQLLYEKRNLAPKRHTIKGVKKSGVVMLLDQLTYTL